MTVQQWFRLPALENGSINRAIEKLQAVSDDSISTVQTETCFYVDLDKNEKELSDDDRKKLLWILQAPFEKSQNLATVSHLKKEDGDVLIEVGPRLNFSTPFSTNAVSMCHSVGLTYIKRIEHSVRYLIKLCPSVTVSSLEDCLYDKMTHCVYREPVTTFDFQAQPKEVFDVDVIGKGRAALEIANKELGLAFDDWDLDYYTKMFKEKVCRNPTSVECFDLAQSNSEHSRHWFFKGRLMIDGKEKPESLFSMVMNTQKHTNSNNVIKFNDNSSAIEGYNMCTLYPQKQAEPSCFVEQECKRHIIFTAETHNFPTGVAPFPGATTGTGGRIRDVQATGRGAHVIAGTAGYCFGNLNLKGYNLPWEDSSFEYPSNFAHPSQVAVQASNGASDYGNKFGEPVLGGFARSFGLDLPDGRREWVKPIMFSGGVGSIESNHVVKEQPKKGHCVVKLGGPVYRIGVGGGAASSVQVQGDNVAALDFGAVQRGDAEMEQKMNRLIRACIEQRKQNPICSIHDQGAGGNGNVLKEICEPAGADIYSSKFELADPSISILELWGAEYQESNAVLVKDEDAATVQKIANREKCPVSFVGHVTGDGKIRLIDDRCDETESSQAKKAKTDVRHPVDLDLDLVLGSMPRKVFHLEHKPPVFRSVMLPTDLTVRAALERVLRLPSVASKRYLTNKVDRSVTGLVAQQQCVGPLHTPLADVAVVALSHLSTVGTATAIGEQPIKGLIDARAGARMSVAEALTNLVFAAISDLKDVKCSGNWMWPAKLPGEGANLHDACAAMCELMHKLGIAIDGGKDSLSMAARIRGKDTVKAPGSLVISAYVGCPDITLTITPDLKCPRSKGILLHIPLSPGNYNLGGSALAQCYRQIGNEAPDLHDPGLFSRAFIAVQTALKRRLLSAGHDISDGGLITTILEMAFAGNCGIDIDISLEDGVSSIDHLFAEELGWVLEIDQTNQDAVLEIFQEADVTCHLIGHSCNPGPTAKVTIICDEVTVVEEKMADLRDLWEETSFALELRQTIPECVVQEQKGLRDRKAPTYHLSFEPQARRIFSETDNITRPKIAVIREEGSNGDREMVAAFHMAGFEVWDLNMHDLCCGKISLDQFRGIAFVGGFSYADVMGSAKGWAATLLFNKSVQQQFDTFYQRKDTFSLGVCNGCQLMALLGWVAADINDGEQVQGVHLATNLSERFESRFCTVKIAGSPAVMLRGMEGSTLGVWVAHGEGRMVFKSKALESTVRSSDLVPIYYADDNGCPTTQYPLNPNGSNAGVAALCSPDGRHLAMMPHPERTVLPWQWAWKPADWQQMNVSPWLQMFHNAYDWCLADVN